MTRWFYILLATALVSQITFAHPRLRRQAELQDSNNLTPVDEESSAEEADRDKRNLEGATEAKFGVKNAILGFVFGKINQFIDAKTRFVDQLDKQNIAQNKKYGIEPPGAPGANLGHIFSSLITPKVNALTGVLGAFSGGGHTDGAGGGSGLGSILRIFTSLSGSSSGGGGAGGASHTISDSSDSNEDDDDDDSK